MVVGHKLVDPTSAEVGKLAEVEGAGRVCKYGFAHDWNRNL